MTIRLILPDTRSTVPDTAENFTERRTATRIAVDDLCEMIIDSGGSKTTCLVHNISSGGALIETSMSSVPKRFILSCSSPNYRAICRVVWHCGGLVGVEILSNNHP